MMARKTNTLSVIASLCLLSACADGGVLLPVRNGTQETDPRDVSVVPLTEKLAETFTAKPVVATKTDLPAIGRWIYKIGPGDVLRVSVFDHPELNIGVANIVTTADASQAAIATPQAVGMPVQIDGTFFFPFVGAVDAAGLTPEQLRKSLTEKLSVFYPDPQLEVGVAEFNAHHVTIAGEVTRPSSIPLTTQPLQLLEAINDAQGLTSLADTANVTIQRDGKIYRVDLHSFLSEGVAANNPVLVPDDIITVRRKAVQEAYVMGSVKAPSVVDLSDAPITITQAVARKGGLDEVRADARGVFVFRRENQETTVYQLDVSSPQGWQIGNLFVLKPEDVVYVTRSPLTRWNDVISRVLPSTITGRTVMESAQ